MKIRLIRHGTVLLSIGSRTLLVDPIFSEKGTVTPIPDVPNQSYNPLVELPVPLDILTACDAILITHTHRDHFDEAAAKALPKDRPVFCQPQDTARITQFGFSNVIPVRKNWSWDSIAISRTPARHGHGKTATAMAPASGFVINSPGEPVVYLTGDSVYFSGTQKILDRYKPDIVVCNCGEATFATGRPITMGIQDLEQILFHKPGTKIVAVHMEAWNHCKLTRAELSSWVEKHNLHEQVFIPFDGEEVKFSNIKPPNITV